MSACLSVSEVTHRYGQTLALDGVSFEVAEGERFGLLGPNGGGKTTMFRLISTLMQPSAGSVSVFGEDVSRSPSAVRRRLGVVFQHTALDAELTVRENLKTHAALVGVTGGTASERIADVLDKLGLADRAKDRVKTLSGGLARRTDLARGLLHHPDLLLLDEPTAGLDPIARRELWDALDGLRRRNGTTQIVATHMMDEAERCDRIGILDRGKLVAIGQPEKLKAELGTETLWLESADPPTLQQHLKARMNLSSRLVGRSVLVEAEKPASLLPAIYEAAGDLITEASLRKPTLEDVFVSVTGHPFSDVTEQPNPL